MRYQLRLVVLTLPLVAVVGCGTAVAPTPGSDGTSPGGGSSGSRGSGSTGAGAASTQVYTATGTVLESPEHGPQLCLGGVAESYPPQCSGPDIDAWDWGAVTGAESASGTTWGSYTVVGTYDGERFTLTEPAQPPAAPTLTANDNQFETPCPPPAGGWAVVDDATATDEAMQAALALAAAAEGYAGSWVDQSINPAWDSESQSESALNDPTKLILNVSTTGDAAELEAQLRELWGGALCVSAAPRTEAELTAILEELAGQPGVLGGYPDTRTGTVELQVIVDDGLQARMDEMYGPGLVTVVPALQPVD